MPEQTLIAPESPKPAGQTSVQNAHAGLKAVDDLLRDPGWMEFTEVWQALQDYKARLRETRPQVNILSNFKRVHDHLHDLQFLCYKLIFEEIKRFPNERISWEALA